MENQETQAEVVVEEQTTTATANPAVEAAPAPEAAPAKKKKLNVGKGILVLVFFLLSLVAFDYIFPFIPWQYMLKIPYFVGLVVWFVGYCITAEKVGKIVRTVGVGLMAIYWIAGIVGTLGVAFEDEESMLGWVMIAVRSLFALAMVAVLALTDWLPKARNAMNKLGNILMLLLIIVNVVTVICGCMTVATFMFFDLVGYTFLALGLKIAKSAVIEARE